jgi:hypothetical protein
MGTVNVVSCCVRAGPQGGFGDAEQDAQARLVEQARVQISAGGLGVVVVDPARVAASVLGKRVDHALVDDLERLTEARCRMDDALGGGTLLPAVREDLRLVVALLDNAAYTGEIGKRLRASGDRAIGASVLSCMGVQAPRPGTVALRAGHRPPRHRFAGPRLRNRNRGSGPHPPLGLPPHPAQASQFPGSRHSLCTLSSRARIRCPSGYGHNRRQTLVTATSGHRPGALRPMPTDRLTGRGVHPSLQARIRPCRSSPGISSNRRYPQDQDR